MDLTTFSTLARYNIWATTRLLDCLQQVSDVDFFKDQGLFFNSIFGTLNHILVGEHYLWFARFSEGRSDALALNQIVIDDRQQLVVQLQEKSQNWLSFLEQLDPEVLQQELHYCTTTGQNLSLPYAATLLHVFNHSTHHRGQITVALTQMGYPCPVLDLVYMLVEDKKK
jgi:uncharacterized damage-inducible protein DinB